MAGNQIATAVTILNSKIGYNGVSISNRDVPDEPEILEGSIVEIANSYFIFPSDETITGWSSITTGTTAYLRLTPAGTAGSQTVAAGWVSTAPTYIASKGGYYLSADSSIRYIYSAIKSSATDYNFKQKLSGFPSTRPTLITTISISATTYSLSGAVEIYEPTDVYAVMTTTNTADTAQIVYTKNINGTYHPDISNVVTRVYVDELANSIGIKPITTTYSVIMTKSLSPGKYKFGIIANSGTMTATASIYRIGRSTDVTQ